MLGSFQSTASLCYSLLPVLSEEGLWELGAVTAVTPQSSPRASLLPARNGGKKIGEKISISGSRYAYWSCKALTEVLLWTQSLFCSSKGRS